MRTVETGCQRRVAFTLSNSIQGDASIAAMIAVALAFLFATGKAGGQILLPAAGNIVTIAGTGTQGCAGNAGAATSATLSQAMGLKVDSAGNVYFADYTCATVSKISASTGIITTVAGNGHEGTGGDGGLATSAKLDYPTDVAVDANGNIFIADAGNSRVRVVNTQSSSITVAGVTVPANDIATIAGSGSYGAPGTGVQATSSAFEFPSGLALDNSGNLYIADFQAKVISALNLTSGILTKVAGTADAGGNTGDGLAAVNAKINGAEFVAVDGAGNLYFTDQYDNVIREVTADHNIHTIAGNGSVGTSPNGTPALSAEFNTPEAIVADSVGNLYIADTGNNVIRMMTASTGNISTIAGNGTGGFTGDGLATSVELKGPQALALDTAANVYIADTGNFRLRAVGSSLPTTPTLTVSSSLSPSTSGQSVTFTTRISSGPTGSIAFYDGSTLLGSGAIAAGTATYATTALSVGNHSITGVWAGNSQYTAVTSSAILQAVNAAGVTVTVTSSNNPSTYNESVTFTAAISAGPTGSITFYDGTTSIGTGTISGTTAAITTSSLNPGTHSIAASWPGNATYGASTSSAITQTVNKIAPSLMVSTSQSPATAGQPVTFTASISNGLTGTITFYDGATSIGTGTLSGGQATFATSTLTVASHSITASWPGSSTYSAVTSPAITETVNSSGSSGSGTISTFAGTGTKSCTGSSGSATSATLSQPMGARVDAAGNAYFADYACATVSEISGGTITTVAGNGHLGNGGDGGPATSAKLDYPTDVVVDASGNLYIADAGNSRVRAVNTQTTSITVFGVTIAAGNIATVAGNGTYGTYNTSQDNHPATSEPLSYPSGLALDSAGNLYIADFQAKVIRMVAAGTGTITTVAGNGTGGYTNDGHLATTAEINGAQFVATDSVGNLYIPDQYDNVIREVDHVSHNINTIAGNGGTGNTGNGGAALSASLNAPEQLALDAQGNLYIADTGNNVIRTVNALSHVISVVAGNGTAGFIDGESATLAELKGPQGVALDAAAIVYASDTGNYRIRKVTSTLQPVAPTITWNTPAAITYGTPLSNTQLNATDAYNGNPVAGTFTYSPVAGTILSAGTRSLSVTFQPSNTAAFSSVTAGVALVVNKATPTVSAWPTASAITFGQSLASSTLTGGSASVPGTFAFANPGTVPQAGTSSQSVTFTPTDSGDYSSPPPGSVSVVVNKATAILTWATPAPISFGTPLGATQLNATASVPGTFTYTPAAGSTPMAGTDALSVIFTPTDTTDYQTIYDWVSIMVSGTSPVINTVAGTFTSGYAGDGGQARDADFNQPWGLAFDAAGNLYISDCYDSVVRKVTATTGIISTFAGIGRYNYSGDGGPANEAGLDCPMGITFDSAGNLYIAEKWGYRIRKVDTSGIITTIAGNGTQGYSGDHGSATQAELDGPGGIAVDGAGNIYFSEAFSNVVRKIAASSSIITTVAGNGTAGFSGDNGPATNAELSLPTAVAVDAAGNLYIADRFNGRVRKVDALTQQISTVIGEVGAMPGVIYQSQVGGAQSDYPAVVVDNYIGDGGPATGAGVYWTEWLALDPAGNIYFSDRGHQRVREMSAGTGIVSTIAGNGSFGSSGDGGTATSAEIGYPAGIAIGPNGNVYFVDTLNPNPTSGGRIRVIGAGGTPTISSWPSASAITFGQTLNSSTLTGGSASVPGTFVWTSPSTVPPIGTSSQSVTFTPTDGLNYRPVTQAVNITVNVPPIPIVTWPMPAPITAGTALSAVQLNATANVPGVFTYFPGPGTVLDPGTYTLHVTFAPTGITGGTVTAAVSLVVNQDQSGQNTPVISWATPAAISYGTALSSTQLDASASYNGANVPGTFEYTPAAGEVLDPGSQTLLVIFFPTDSVHYTTAGGSVVLVVSPSSTQPLNIYNYSITGYASNSNLLNYTDSVTGTWSFNYDSLNRLVAGTPTPSSGNILCWSYDPFGNRTTQTSQSAACPTLPSLPTATVNYNANNQVTGGFLSYDAAGNVTFDTTTGNTYIYDGDGRICAVKSEPVPGTYSMTAYVYDAEGNRVAKGALSSWPTNNLCPNLAATGVFTPTNSYVLGPSGEQLTETDGNGNWIHSNVYAAGTLIATYDSAPTGAPALHFQLEDWLGSRRVQADISGNLEETFANLPFGDALITTPASGAPPTADDATEHHFTGKERDTESGNDYFGARYYASSMGRFSSPDPGWFFATDPENPQSWNLYSYVLNNPLSLLDPDGYDCVYLNDAGTDVDRDASGNPTGIDQNSNQGECEGNKGYWVNGTVTGVYLSINSNDVYLAGQLDNGNASSNSYFPNAETVRVTGGTGDTIPTSGSFIDVMFQYEGYDYSDTLQGKDPWPTRYFGTHWCGPGGGGVPVNALDAACKAHDECYAAAGISAASNTGGQGMTLAQATAAQACNQALYSAAKSHPFIWGSAQVRTWLKNGDKLSILTGGMHADVLAPGTGIQ